MRKRFGLIGAAGFVAPRHMAAIAELGHELAAILDPHDAVGVIDRHAPEADYFREFERFDRHVDKCRRQGRPLDYMSICSPNYLHDSHIRFALRSGLDVICEKPTVLNPWNLDALAGIEAETGRRVSTILQLRLNPNVVALRQRLAAAPGDRRHRVELTYVTGRGHWYDHSWKGDVDKSGGIITNIGIHFFDLLIHLFGPVTGWRLQANGPRRAAGTLDLATADVRWLLSINLADLPAEMPAGATTFRMLDIDGEQLEFSKLFTDLHTESYRRILAGASFGLDEARASIELASTMRRAAPDASGDWQPSVVRTNQASSVGSRRAADRQP